MSKRQGGVGALDRRFSFPADGNMVRVPFRDLSVSDPTVRRALLAAVERVLAHGRLILGPEVAALEQRIADTVGTRYCVGVASGTDALYLALRAHGIGPGDEVVTTPLSWIATANAIHLTGAVPVFADIGADLNIDTRRIEDALSPATKAIVPVHFNGRLCEMGRIGDIARRHDLLVIEDAAQAFGAELAGAKAGSFGHAAAFSFNPMKVLAAFGEAGAVVTDGGEVCQRLRAMRSLGIDEADRESCRWPSLNAKIDTLQAAMLLVAFDGFEANVARRRRIASLYRQELAGLVGCPPGDANETRRSVFFDYQIVVERRSALGAFLAERGIETKVKHPILLPDQPPYRDLPGRALPMAKRMVERILCLPIHEKMTDDDVRLVARTIREFHERR